jgi:hypothetical protein
VTTGDRPSCRIGQAEHTPILDSEKANYFYRGGLTGFRPLCPSGKHRCRSTVALPHFRSGIGAGRGNPQGKRRHRPFPYSPSSPTCQSAARIDGAVRGDIVDLTARNADIPEFQVVEAGQIGSQPFARAPFLKCIPASPEKA